MFKRDLRDKRNSTAMVMLNSNSGADLMGDVDIRTKSTLEQSVMTYRSNKSTYESTFGKAK